MSLLERQNRLKYEYEDLDVLLWVNKSDLAGMTEFIKEYHRSCCGFIKKPLVYFIRKTIIAQIYDDCLSMQFLVMKDCQDVASTPDKIKLDKEQSA